MKISLLQALRSPTDYGTTLTNSPLALRLAVQYNNTLTTCGYRAPEMGPVQTETGCK